jgi:large subunit ribosomal protein L3
MIKKVPVKKIGMTSAFDGSGTTIPATIVQPLPVHVTAIKRAETHGYSAVQLAYSDTLAKRINKPHKGILAKAGIDKPLKKLYESRVEASELEGLEPGQEIDLAGLIGNWRLVKATGTSKGKGFAGVMKRWGFAGQQRTHGDPDERRPMANNSTDPARVFKGSRRPGRMGNKTKTIKRVSVFDYDKENNLLVLSGSLPGPNGGMLFLSLVAEREVEE